MKYLVLTSIIILFHCPIVFALNCDNWQNSIEEKIEADIKKQEYIDKQNVFLFYEIYDSLWRKYGYKYIKNTTTHYQEPTLRIKRTSSSSDLEATFRKYDSQIKAGNYYNLSRELIDLIDKQDVEYSAEYEYSMTSYELQPNVSKKRIMKEALQIYKKKMYSTQPKPYSMNSEIKKYANLRTADVDFIAQQFEKRMSTKKIDLDNMQSVKYDLYCLTNDLSCKFYHGLYEYFELNPDKKPSIFRSTANYIDSDYSKYYPQNISATNNPFYIKNSKIRLEDLK